MTPQQIQEWTAAIATTNSRQEPGASVWSTAAPLDRPPSARRSAPVCVQDACALDPPTRRRRTGPRGADRLPSAALRSVRLASGIPGRAATAMQASAMPATSASDAARRPGTARRSASQARQYPTSELSIPPSESSPSSATARSAVRRLAQAERALPSEYITEMSVCRNLAARSASAPKCSGLRRGIEAECRRDCWSCVGALLRKCRRLQSKRECHQRRGRCEAPLRLAGLATRPAEARPPSDPRPCSVAARAERRRLAWQDPDRPCRSRGATARRTRVGQRERQRLVVRVEAEQERVVRRSASPRGPATRDRLPFRKTINDLAKPTVQSSSDISLPAGVNHAMSRTPAPWSGRPSNQRRRRNTG